MNIDTDVVVVGGGLVGASMALALSRAGFRSTVVEAVPPDSSAQPSFDERTIALTYSARQVFAGLGVWDALQASGELSPIKTIEVSDRGEPGVCTLSHADAGLDALGYVVPTRVLGRVLHRCLQDDELIDLRCPARTFDVQSDTGLVSARIGTTANEQTVSARLLVLADGGRSPLAKELGFDATRQRYAQSALVTVIATDSPHYGRAYERFVGVGPLAVLPVRERDYAVAWTLPAEQAQRFLNFSDKQFCAELADAVEQRLGHIESCGPRLAYPLDLTRVRQPATGRVVAVGNAAHVVHPVAGQGFNLGLRDVVGLADCLSGANSERRDIGTAETVAAYLSEREEETRRVSGFTDAMIGVFSSRLAPVRRGRNAALGLIDRAPALRRELLWRTTGMNSSQARVVDRLHDADCAHGIDQVFDVIVAGAGLIGAAMACALGGSGYRVALIDKALPEPLPEPLDGYDLRINAYNRAAEQLLRDLDVWERLPAGRVYPFRHVYVGNERGSGSVTFSAHDVGETHLGHFIENRLVSRALLERAAEFSNIDVLSGRDVQRARFGQDRAVLDCADGETLQAALLIGADGANSRVRDAAGIGVRMRPYHQRCVVGTIEFTGDLEETAWQRFLFTGPLGLLPLAPGFCSLAWSCVNKRAEQLMQLDEPAFIAELENAVAGRLGKITRVGPRGAFPLTARDAVSYVGARTALVGDAAHVVHPLAGLGANIGFMDVLTLAQILLRADGDQSSDIGGTRLLRRYGRQRQAENRLLMTTMSAFNTVFSNDDSLLGVLRDSGLRFADQVLPAKNFLMRRAMWMDFSPLRLGRVATPPPQGQSREQS